jgi:hypothetical protein
MFAVDRHPNRCGIFRFVFGIKCKGLLEINPPAVRSTMNRSGLKIRMKKAITGCGFREDRASKLFGLCRIFVRPRDTFIIRSVMLVAVRVWEKAAYGHAKLKFRV